MRVIKCDNCEKEMQVIRVEASYRYTPPIQKDRVSSTRMPKVDFCSPKCASEYFANPKLEIDT